MIYNQSRITVEERGLRGKRIVSETDSTFTARVLDLFDLNVLRLDEEVTPQLVNNGFYQSNIVSWLTRWVRPGMTVIDVGAGYGYYTMLSEKLVGTHGLVVAYEPNPVYAELLRATRGINDAKFSLREVGLSNKVGTLTCKVDTKVTVRTTTLDNELQHLVFWNHDLVIIHNCYVAEDVIEGGKTLWDAEQAHSTIIFKYNPKDCSKEFLDNIFEWGYVFFITTDGGEEPLTRNELADGQTLVIRRK